MPLYDYQCKMCGGSFEVRASIKEKEWYSQCSASGSCSPDEVSSVAIPTGHMPVCQPLSMDFQGNRSSHVGR